MHTQRENIHLSYWSYFPAVKTMQVRTLHLAHFNIFEDVKVIEYNSTYITFNGISYIPDVLLCKILAQYWKPITPITGFFLNVLESFYFKSFKPSVLWFGSRSGQVNVCIEPRRLYMCKCRYVGTFYYALNYKYYINWPNGSLKKRKQMCSWYVNLHERFGRQKTWQVLYFIILLINSSSREW